MSQNNEPTQQLRQNEIRDQVGRLPRVGSDRRLVDPTTASAVFRELEQSGSEIPASIRNLSRRITTDSLKDLESVPDHPDAHVVTDLELQGLTARAAIAGAAQALIGIAESGHEAAMLEGIYRLGVPDTTNDAA